jgi:hypothetical protein
VSVTVEESAELLRRLVAGSGFDPARPDPALAWAAFKRYAAVPVEEVPTTRWCFEATAAWGPRTPAYLGFARVFEDPSPRGYGEEVVAHFTAPPGVQPGPPAACCHAEGVESLPAWFAAVEALPAFRAALGYTGWSFEVAVYGLW